MTARIFQALARHAVKTPHSAALRSAERCIDYAALVAFLAANGDMLAGTQRVIGINTADPLDAALADLALVYYGHVPVHLPPFFSVAQKAHIITATGMDIVVGDAVAGAKAMQLCRPEDSRSLAALAPPVANARRIIFTSGSSGQPRGVVIGERQMAAALDGLEKAIRPDVSDIHLSLLPMAQLLEQIAGLYLPLLAGAQVRFCPEALPALFGGPMAPVLAALHDAQPTSTILVPAFLARLVSDLRATGRRAPDSLRLIAVGGAATSPALLADAISEGLPVYEGYGLSECCSVVSLNRPGTARAGTVGTVLDGVGVRIENGEIVVSGPTVMDGYLGQPSVTGDWYTGDLGRIEDGRLIVEGRKDWLIVTPQGRNINPEWVEACLCADPRIPAAGLHLDADGQLTIIAAVAARIERDEVARLLAPLPAYARPSRVIFVPAAQDGLLKPGVGIDRSQLAHLAATYPSHPLFHDTKECIA